VSADQIVKLFTSRHRHFPRILRTSQFYGYNAPTYIIQQNLNAALRRGQGAVTPVYEWMNSHPGVNVTATDFNSSALLFRNLGIGFNDFVNDMNLYTTLGIQLENNSIVQTGQLFEEMSLIYTILEVSTACPSLC
jgi:hypothetical protein